MTLVSVASVCIFLFHKYLYICVCTCVFYIAVSSGCYIKFKVQGGESHRPLESPLVSGPPAVMSSTQ